MIQAHIKISTGEKWEDPKEYVDDWVVHVVTRVTNEQRVAWPNVIVMIGDLQIDRHFFDVKQGKNLMGIMHVEYQFAKIWRVSYTQQKCSSNDISNFKFWYSCEKPLKIIYVKYYAKILISMSYIHIPCINICMYMLAYIKSRRLKRRKFFNYYCHYFYFKLLIFLHLL